MRSSKSPALVLTFFVATLIAAPPAPTAPYGNLPLRFEVAPPHESLHDTPAVPNVPSPAFLSHAGNYNLFLAPGEATFDFGPASTLHMRLTGANPVSQITGLTELPGRTNYLIGADPTHWRTKVPNYAQVKYSALYPGIDLIFYGNQRQLEYDFVLAPGADPSAIRLNFNLPYIPRIDPHGDLVISLDGNELRWRKPLVYQNLNGVRHAVAGRFAHRPNHQIGFDIASYDRTQPLIIDPILTTAFSTYLGGTQQDSAPAIAVDASDSAYVAGWTRSTDFPTVNALQPASAGGPEDVFVAKFSPDGTKLIYCTYVGGSDRDFAWGIAIDSAGNAYVTGETRSSDFPAIHSIQTFAGGASHAFAFKLDSTGSNLIYSTQFGGNPQAIAVDSSGSAYVAGSTTGADFSVLNAVQPVYGGGPSDGFVVKLAPSGDHFIYATYFGGNAFDIVKGIAVDSAGNAYFAGTTGSKDLPLKNPLQSVFRSSLGSNTAFVAKLNAAGSNLLYSTYLGGSIFDAANGIAVDPAGNAYVAGVTDSPDFPTVNAAQSTSLTSAADAFVSKLDPTGSTLLYSTLLGGSQDDRAYAIAVDAAGSAYITGTTTSLDFPLASPLAPQLAGSPGAMFIAKLAPSGKTLVFSSYFGGPFVGYGVASAAIAVDPLGNTYVSGLTTSSTFPAVNALQPQYRGGFDAFVAKFTLTDGGNPVPAISSISPASLDINGPQFTLTVNGGNFIPASVVRWNGTPRPTTFVGATQLTAAIPSFDLARPFPVSVSVFTPTPGGGTSNPLPFTINGTLPPVLQFFSPLALTAGGPPATIQVFGNNLTAAALVLWNGSPRPTRLAVDSGVPQATLNVDLTAADLATAGKATLAISMPPPGGGLSNTLTFPILPAPVFYTGGIVNSANFLPAVSPGGLASLFGANFTVSPYNSAGVTVELDGVAAPLNYVGTNQVNFQIPWELQGKVSASAAVIANGVRTAPQTLNLSQFAPAIYTLNLQGSGQAAALLAGTRQFACNPSPGKPCLGGGTPVKKGGSIELYLTGLGAVLEPARLGKAGASGAAIQHHHAPYRHAWGSSRHRYLFRPRPQLRRTLPAQHSDPAKCANRGRRASRYHPGHDRLQHRNHSCPVVRKRSEVPG